MQKKFDNAFAALMLAAAIAVVLAGAWCLSHSIERTKAEMEPIQVAQVHIDALAPTPTPPPLPTPTPMPTQAPFSESIPLDPGLQVMLYQTCETSGVPVALALGVIEVESCFQVDADGGRCYGLMQLNRDYFPDKLSPADNIRFGVEYLGRLLAQYGDTGAALCSYNAGHDTGSRVYANAVLRAAEWWEGELQ